MPLRDLKKQLLDLCHLLLKSKSATAVIFVVCCKAFAHLKATKVSLPKEHESGLKTKGIFKYYH